MTINVAVKCPGGLVLGTDSLVSVVRDGGGEGEAPRALALVPHHRKLFQLGRLQAGVLLNGDISVRGRRVEDMLTEFANQQRWDPTSYDLGQVVKALSTHLKARFRGVRAPALQLIVAGYSPAKPQDEYGEIYKLTWPAGTLEQLYAGDQRFGSVYGGDPDPIFRFLYGFDRQTAGALFLNWDGLYGQTRDYIIEHLEKGGVAIPDGLKDLPRPHIRSVQPWQLLSDFDLGDRKLSTEQLFEGITEDSQHEYASAFLYYSLGMAVNFTWHMLMIAYAASNFFLRLPVVGSELRIATITRERGFQRVWEGVPGIASGE